MAAQVFGSLPGFIVIGAMRAATTTLHQHLTAHPDVGMSREKETDFFVAELNFSRGLPWYRSLFPEGRKICGESSPNYTKFDVFPGVPARIKQHVPDCKLIYVVRDPVKRAVSHYNFSEIMKNYSNLKSRMDHIIYTSKYYYQISNYMKYFDINDILIVDFDDLQNQPLVTLNQVSEFLRLSNSWNAVSAINANSAEELARMPPWFLRLRRNRLVSDLRRKLPRTAAFGLRRLVASGSARTVAPLDQVAIDHLRTALADDARRFRYLTGRSFANWSV